MPTMSIIFQGLFLTFILLKSTRCSRVLDKLSQNTIYVSTYCPKQKYCEEGSHVMCMYYDHEQTIGHRCKNFVETEITSQLVQQILDIVNEIRSRLATGVERGKDGLVLPRAYGMMRMVWDSELATLAQVLANQCLGGREDLCRATDKFPNPSQSIAIVQFRFPDWEYVKMNSTEKGLTEEKLSFSVDRFLKSLHALRKTASREIISNCPPFQELPDRHLRYYLNLIRGGATHIGCGLSAYTRYHDDGGRQSIRNSVQIVCNISDGPQPSEPVYTTDPPEPGDGYSEDCGCPPGHREADGCLCEIDPDYMSTITATTEPSYFNLHSKFKFKKTNQRAEITTERQRWTEIQLKAQTLRSPEVETVRSQAGRSCSDDSMTNCEVKVVVLPILSIKDGPPDKMPDNEHLQPFNNTFEPRHRVIDKLEYSGETFKELTNALTMRPEAKYKSRFIYQKNVPKKINSNKSTEKLHHDFNTASVKKVQDWYSSEDADQQYDISDDAAHNINLTNRETDHKLLDLLNVLEQEVKNIELNGNLRHLFDAKMRKIYGTALSAPRDRQQYGYHLRELKDFLKNKFIPHLEDEKLADDIDGSTKDDEHKEDEHAFSENEIKQTQKNNKSDRKYFDSLQSAKQNNYLDKSLVYTPDQHAYEDHATSDLENHVDYNFNKKRLDSDHQNLEHKYDEDDTDYPQETFVIRAQENMAPYNNKDLIEQNAIGSKEIEHKNLAKHDNKRIDYDDIMPEEVVVNRRRMDDTKKLPDLYKRFNSLERLLPYIESPGRRTQISHNFRRIFGHGNMRPMRLMRPNLADVIRPRFPRHRFEVSLSDRERY